MRIIERCAIAIRDARALPGTNPVARLSDVDRRAARAVLEVLREPVGARLAMLHGARSGSDFSAMIDAILSEGGE